MMNHPFTHLPMHLLGFRQRLLRFLQLGTEPQHALRQVPHLGTARAARDIQLLGPSSDAISMENAWAMLGYHHAYTPIQDQSNC